MSNAGPDQRLKEPDIAPKGLNVSLVQLVASALASVSAAFIASLFGVTGTIIGTAVVSVVATSASAIYGLWLRRTQHHLRRLRDQALRASATTRSAGAQPHPGMWPAHRRAPARGAGGAAGQVRPATGATHDRWPEEDRSLPERPPAALGAPVARPGDVTVAHARPPIPERHRRFLPGRLRLPLAAGVLAVFVVAAGVTTIIEVIARQPLASVVTGSSQHGTTFFGTTPAAPSTTTVPTTTTTLPVTSTTTPTVSEPSSTTTSTTTTVPSTTTTTLPAPGTTVPSNGGSSPTTTSTGSGATPAGTSG